MTGFTEQLVEANRGLWAAMAGHPFVLGLAACRPFYRDHFLTQVGTGLRSGELLGLRRRRVYLAGPNNRCCCRAAEGFDRRSAIFTL